MDAKENTRKLCSAVFGFVTCTSDGSIDGGLRGLPNPAVLLKKLTSYRDVCKRNIGTCPLGLGRSERYGHAPVVTRFILRHPAQDGPWCAETLNISN